MNMQANRVFKCNLDGRTFKTRAAHTAHMLDAHPVSRKSQVSTLKGKSKKVGNRAITVIDGGMTPSEAPGKVGGMRSKTNLLHDYLMQHQLLGATDEGAKFFMAHCHPMDEIDLGPVRMPDLVTCNTVAAELRAALTIPSPIPEGTTNATWDCMIATIPFPDIAFVYRVKASSSADWGRWIGVPFQQVPYGNLDVSTVTAPTKTEGGMWPLIKDVRAVSRGLTVDLQASALTDGGTCYSAQFPSVPNWKESYNSISALDAGLKSSAIYSMRLPYDYNDIVAMDDGFTEWQARQGCYIPVGFVNPANQFSANLAGELHYNNSGGTDTLLGMGGGIVELRDSHMSIPMQFVYTPDTTSTTPGSGTVKLVEPFGPDNTQIGVTLFVGLHPLSSLAARTKYRLEGTTSFDSAWSPFIAKSPIYDQKATEHAIIVKGELQHAYPAEYNSLGKILRSIGQAIVSVIKPVASISGAIGGLGIPGVSSIANIVNKIATTADDILS
ncbi:capsid protein [Mosinovirus]|nr:capsid protein [Mosinovirus]